MLTYVLCLRRTVPFQVNGTWLPLSLLRGLGRRSAPAKLARSRLVRLDPATNPILIRQLPWNGQRHVLVDVMVPKPHLSARVTQVD